MSIYRPQGRRFWLYDFRLNGTRFHGSTGQTKKHDARTVELELRQKHARHQDSFAAACAHYESYAKGQPSLKTTEYQLHRLLDALGESTLVADIGDREVAEYIAVRRGEKTKRGAYPSAATINREIELLRRVLNKARRALKLDTQEIDWKVHRLKESPPRTRVLTEEEESRLLAELAPHLKDPVKLALITGLRLSNIIKMDWEQVDMRARRITLTLKGNRAHSITMNGAVLAILARQNPRKAGRVFLYRKAPITTFKTAWRAALRRAKIEDFRFHDTRHTAASRMVRKVGIGLTKKALGHASITSTQRYAHFEDDDIALAFDAASPDITPDIDDASA